MTDTTATKKAIVDMTNAMSPDMTINLFDQGVLTILSVALYFFCRKNDKGIFYSIFVAMIGPYLLKAVFKMGDGLWDYGIGGIALVISVIMLGQAFISWIRSNQVVSNNTHYQSNNRYGQTQHHVSARVPDAAYRSSNNSSRPMKYN